MRRRTLDGRGRGTLAVWAGEDVNGDHKARSSSVVQPVYHGVSFAYDDVDEWHAVALGRKRGHIYSRNTNPTVRCFEEKVRRVEGAEASTSFATGMAAISNTLFALLSPGDRLVSIKETYGGTTTVMHEFLPRFGIEVALCDTNDHDGIERELASGGCKVLYLESPTNPSLHVLDLARLARAGRAAGATVIVDNTFATAINQRPLELGADLVVYSATKYLGGHSDAMGGMLCGPAELVEQVFHFREINGASLHPEAAYLLLRGMKTLELRMARHNDSAMRVARFLEQHPKVREVRYPGLESHPGHAIARRQMSGFGGMLSFAVEGGFEAARTVLHGLELAHLAASLGAVETLAAPPRTSSHVECTAAQRESMGVPEGLIRYSVGIENPDDLMADLGRALDALGR